MAGTLISIPIMIGSGSVLRIDGHRTMELTSGQTLGRYEIKSYLGAGGMGVVYRAHDSQLGREVAVKILNEDAASSPTRIKRFEQEARAVARLSHPNILDIYDFGTHDGTTYAVTELLHGQTLGDRLSKGQIPLNKTLEICRAIAEGLAAAHSEGIVHRDLKPSNIFITDSGQVKILDFGIARLKERPVDEPSPSAEMPTESLTGVGKMVGTVGYMSPEQIEGKEADARSDIFGLGCVMFEILTNRRAFLGETTNDTILAILGKDPEPIADLRSEVPQAVEMVVRRCLEKQPGERFESAREVASALQAISWDRSGEQESPKPPKSPHRRVIEWAVWILAACAVGIAVWPVLTKLLTPPLPERTKLGLVPFEVISEEPSLEAFGAGLREILADDLALIAQQEESIAWIIPNEEAKSNGALTAADLGRYFGATLAITGELRSFGDRIRLEIRLVDPKSGRTLRAASIEDIPSNVEIFQKGPMLRVVEMFEITISPEMMERLNAGKTTMTNAFDAFTRGCGTLVLGGDPESVSSASALAGDAISEDPLFAAAWVLKARCDLAEFGVTGDRFAIETGIENAGKSLESGGRAEAVWRVIGKLHLASGNVDDAVTALETGVESAPEDPEMRLYLAAALQQSGRIADADAELRRAIFLRPDYWVAYDRLATLYRSQGMWEAAGIEYQHAIDYAPDFALGYVKLGGVNWYLGRVEEAITLFERSLEIEPTYHALSNLGSIHFNAYRYAAASEMFEDALELDDSSYVVWGNLGYAYQFGIEPDKAAAAFERALELAQEQHLAEPDNHQHTILIAGYHAMLGERERGLQVLQAVIDAQPTNPLYISMIAETFEDLGNREQALEWVERSFASGEPRSRFEGRPTLRKLVADERYQALAEDHFGAP